LACRGGAASEAGGTVDAVSGVRELRWVSETPPEAADFDDDDSVLSKCSGLSGSGAEASLREASLRDKIEACRSTASARGRTLRVAADRTLLSLSHFTSPLSARKRGRRGHRDWYGYHHPHGVYRRHVHPHAGGPGAARWGSRFGGLSPRASEGVYHALRPGRPDAVRHGGLRDLRRQPLQ
ncbi:unnamed protein product, partial [Ectocarpus fasciculatus]